MTKMMQITNELKDWIVSTLKSDVSPIAIVNALIKKVSIAGLHMRRFFKIVGNEAIKTTDRQQIRYN